MSGVSYIGHRRAGPAQPADLLERRTRRLVQRVHAASEPITWLCAGAGSGKSRLLELLRAGNDAVAVLDEPTPDALMQGLADLAAARIRRLLIATRPESAISALLLREQMYGRVLLIGEPALFVTSEDAVGESDEALLSDTGGWPMLVAAGLEGRSREARELLPAFLERHVVPHWPEPLLVALFAALTAPLSHAAASELCVTQGPYHPLLQELDGVWQVRGRWVREAFAVLRATTVMPPTVRERLKAVYSQLPSPDRAIAALVAMGATADALELFKQAGGVFFGYRNGYRSLDAVLRVFGSALEESVEELFLARLWLLIKSGRPREALMSLEARHPRLPVDLRKLRLTHRAEAILLRIDMAVDMDEPPPPEVIASWGTPATLLARRRSDCTRHPLQRHGDRLSAGGRAGRGAESG